MLCDIVLHRCQNCQPLAACCRHLHTGRGWGWGWATLTNELEKFANSGAGTALLTRRPGGGCQISPYPALSSEQLVHTNTEDTTLSTGYCGHSCSF